MTAFDLYAEVTRLRAQQREYSAALQKASRERNEALSQAAILKRERDAARQQLAEARAQLEQLRPVFAAGIRGVA